MSKGVRKKRERERERDAPPQPLHPRDLDRVVVGQPPSKFDDLLFLYLPSLLQRCLELHRLPLPSPTPKLQRLNTLHQLLLPFAPSRPRAALFQPIREMIRTLRPTRFRPSSPPLLHLPLISHAPPPPTPPSPPNHTHPNRLTRRKSPLNPQHPRSKQPPSVPSSSSIPFSTGNRTVSAFVDEDGTPGREAVEDPETTGGEGGGFGREEGVGGEGGTVGERAGGDEFDARRGGGGGDRNGLGGGGGGEGRKLRERGGERGRRSRAVLMSLYDTEDSLRVRAHRDYGCATRGGGKFGGDELRFHPTGAEGRTES